MAFIHSPRTVTNGLVVYFDTGNSKSYTSGSATCTDISNTGNNGSLVNSPTFDGNNGGSIVLNGSSQVINIANNSTLNVTSQISLEAWIYPTKNSGYQNVISKSSSAASNGYIYPRTDNGWTQSVFYLNVGGWSTLSATWPSINRWHHTIGTYDGSNMRIYINGMQAASKSQTGTISTNTNQLVIGNQPAYNEYYGGRIGIIKMYNRALTTTEVLQNFNATRARFGV